MDSLRKFGKSLQFFTSPGNLPGLNNVMVDFVYEPMVVCCTDQLQPHDLYTVLDDVVRRGHQSGHGHQCVHLVGVVEDFQVKVFLQDLQLFPSPLLLVIWQIQKTVGLNLVWFNNTMNNIMSFWCQGCV